VPPGATNTRGFETSQTGPKAKTTPSFCYEWRETDSGADVPLHRIGNQVPSRALVLPRQEVMFAEWSDAEYEVHSGAKRIKQTEVLIGIYSTLISNHRWRLARRVSS
jgi:hypothetical protein